ncbi:two-component regulator propeller domain-containing protein [Roseateles asaccharophilus]|uniref:diguanylate cyclase n=1 Tax=Roseateles asaccharophilus TaxID=582607 RepID=A0ABU2AB83_9BURK|nr:two-component regulator propeller domain-containing protein [Roseateles asaccharophilus]MDR7334463.1 diguanylate cyclase (GGDEF)-like protein [Roseateles asaccharophilus]
MLYSLRCGLRCLLVGLTLTGAGHGLHAAPEPQHDRLADIAFQHVTQDQGLPNAIATTLAEDGQGFLWIGSPGGLSRWDGYRFRVYQADPLRDGALPDNYVQALHGDTQGRLWVGTTSAGLLRHDPATDRFVRYAAGGGRGLSHVSVRQVLDDGDGGLWIVTDGGLDRLDPASGRIEHASRGWAVAAGAQVRVLLRDRRGALWLGSAAGLFRREPGATGVVAVPLRGGVTVQPEVLRQDGAGRIWVGSLQHGVFVLADEGRAPASPVRERAMPDGQDVLRDSQIAGLAEVQPGEMWIATQAQGLVAVNLDQAETRRIRHVPAWPMSLADNALRALYRDRAGLVWVATNRGLSRHDPRQSGVLSRFGVTPDGGDALDARFVSTEISWIEPRPDGGLWLGTHKSGVDILDATGRRVGALRPDAARPDTALPADIVLAMAPAPDGSVFLGTKRGLYRADGAGRRVTRVALPGRDPAASVWTLLADGDDLWVGGQADGLWRLDLRSGQGEAVALAAPGLSDQRITVLARDTREAGVLWVGTRHGLNRVTLAGRRVSQWLPGPVGAGALSAGFITALLTDDRGRLWVGSYGGGIDVLLSRGDAPLRLGTGQGLPDSTVNAMLQDLQGRIWASTDNGLARIDAQTLAVTALRRAEGVVFPTYWTGSAARTARGELLFGGAGGMTVVLPEKLQAWTYRPTVLVTDVKLGGQPLPLNPAGGALTVKPDANSLAVEFSSTDFSAPERNRFAYQLEGYDAGWVPTDASRRLAAYANLPPGDYRLRLRASNRDGQWSERELALPIRVLPAWHQTWWFRAGVALGAGLLLLTAVRLRTRLLRQRQRELEDKVRQRTAELEALHRTLEQKSAELQMSSVTDPLTGLHNRRFLTDHIEQDLAASLRRAQETLAAGGQPLDTDSVFLLLDVDAFKRINDRHGHAAGDAVLVQFGARLRSVLRESDYLVRWGGEEFLAVARDTDRAQAEELAERMRGVIAAEPFQLDDGGEIAVTCSVGFACVPFELERPQARSWQQVVNLADLALYAAKRSGRNAWVGVHTAHGRGAIGRQVVGGFGVSSNRPLDEVTAALASPAEPDAVV